MPRDNAIEVETSIRQSWTEKVLEGDSPDTPDSYGSKTTLGDGSTQDIISTTSVSSNDQKQCIDDVASVPDGGMRAWLQVFGSFFLFFSTLGISNAFGVYQTYYETGQLFSASPADISWIGSVQGFLLQFLGPLIGPLYDAGYFRALVITGSFFAVFGQIMLSFCREYYQVLLAQALCVGAGFGCLFLPGVAILSQYFHKRLALATGVAILGSSLGGILYPIMLYKLLPTVGFAWATRVLGLITLATLLVSVLVMKVRVLPPQRRRIVDLPALKEPPFTLFTIGCFLGWLGIWVPYFYVGPFSISYGLGSESSSFYLIAIINAGSMLGRLIPNFFADRTGPMNMISPMTMIAGILTLCLIPVRSFAALVVVSALYGFCTGAMVSLYSTVYVRLSMHRRALIGTRLGMGLFVSSIALLLGTPICGWILAASSYIFVWLFSGLLLCTGSLFMWMGRLAKTKREGIFARA